MSERRLTLIEKILQESRYGIPDYTLQSIKEKYGIVKALGGGYHGTAFLTKDNKVVKITNSKFEVKFYIDKKNKNLKHFVKIYEIKKISLPSNYPVQYYLIVKDYVQRLLNQDEKTIMFDYMYYPDEMEKNLHGFDLDQSTIYFLNQLKELKKELHVTSNNDLNDDNIGWNGNTLVAFDVQSTSSRINDKKIDVFQESLLLEKKSNYKYGCVMLNVNLPGIHEIQSRIKKEDIYEEKDNDKFGLEKEQHITLLYGIHKEVKPDEVKSIIDSFSFPSTITLNKISIFDTDERYDVLKFEVDKTFLGKINKRLRKLPYTNDYPDYNPHMTIAYLKKGMGRIYMEKMKGIKNIDAKVDDVLFNTPSGKKTTIKIKKKDLKEAKIITKSPLCVVDVQPAHQNFITFDIYKFTQFLNKHKGLIIYLFNGPDFGYESNKEIKSWLLDHEIDENVLDKIIFYEKNYGFFRNYLDQYGWDDDLTTVLKYMLENKIYYSENIDINQLPPVNDQMIDFLRNGDTIYIPDVINLLKKYNNYDLCGGGQMECLWEIEILLTIMGKSFTKIQQFIY